MSTPLELLSASTSFNIFFKKGFFLVNISFQIYFSQTHPFLFSLVYILSRIFLALSSSPLTPSSTWYVSRSPSRPPVRSAGHHPRSLAHFADHIPCSLARSPPRSLRMWWTLCRVVCSFRISLDFYIYN